MKKYIFLFLLITVAVSARSQQSTTEAKGYRFNNNFDLGLSTGGGQSSGAFSWIHFYSVTKNKQFKIGYGIRFTSQIGKDLTYQTAPAILTSKQRGPQVLFSPIYYENIDTFVVSSAQNNALNLSINLQYTFKKKFDIGFNIDALGFSFGKKISGKYLSPQDNINTQLQAAKPTPLNLLLVSDNDIGTLNSELYLRYWFHKNWGFKLGATFLFTEYTTNNKLRLENDRWRNKSFMGMIGVTYTPFK